MVLLPYERVSVRSAVPLAELQRKLADSVEPRKWRWPWQTKHRAFEGRVEGTRFKINCVIHYRNSFLPVIEGELRENSDGVTLHASVGVPPATPGAPYPRSHRREEVALSTCAPSRRLRPSRRRAPRQPWRETDSALSSASPRTPPTLAPAGSTRATAGPAALAPASMGRELRHSSPFRPPFARPGPSTRPLPLVCPLRVQPMRWRRGAESRSVRPNTGHSLQGSGGAAFPARRSRAGQRWDLR